jgi:hypothetical protein
MVEIVGFIDELQSKKVVNSIGNFRALSYDNIK